MATPPKTQPDTTPAPGPDDVTLPGMDSTPTPDKPPAGSKPRKRSASKPSASRGPGRPSNAAKLEAQLTNLFTTIAGVGQLATMTNPTVSRDFTIIGAQAEPLAAALVKLSETSPPVRKVLESMVQTSAYGEVITILAGGIALPIMANHGLLPAFMASALTGAEAAATTSTDAAAA